MAITWTRDGHARHDVNPERDEGDAVAPSAPFGSMSKFPLSVMRDFSPYPAVCSLRKEPALLHQWGIATPTEAPDA
jgi:hypothetical protein